MSIERELEHTTDGDAGALATLSEEQQNIVQMQQIADMTVEPGVMRLPVTSVTTSENSGNWVIDVDHPLEGEIRVFRDKPQYGWHEDQELVELLDWYEIHDRDPYKLQVEQVYIEHNPEEADQNHGWQLTEPPWVEQKRELRRKQQPLHRRAWDWLDGKRPGRSVEVVWGLLFASTVLSGFTAGILATLGMGLALTVVPPLVFMTATILAAIVTDPPGDS